MKQVVDRLLAEIEERFGHMAATLAAGDDVAPGVSLRTEGLMEAAVLAGLATPAELDALLCDRFQSAGTIDPVSWLGPDWRSFYPFPQIPVLMRRAPVFPSTSD